MLGVYAELDDARQRDAATRPRPRSSAAGLTHELVTFPTRTTRSSTTPARATTRRRRPRPSARARLVRAVRGQGLGAERSRPGASARPPPRSYGAASDRRSPKKKPPDDRDEDDGDDDPDDELPEAAEDQSCNHQRRDAEQNRHDPAHRIGSPDGRSRPSAPTMAPTMISHIQCMGRSFPRQRRPQTPANEPPATPLQRAVRAAGP